MTSNQTKASQKRKPRFKRVANHKFQLQGRDIEIIKQVYKHRLLTSGHIKELVGGSGQGILRRLQALYHNQYLDRPREQIKYYRAGSQPMIYGLGNKGAKLLTSDFNVPRSKVDWTSKNRELKITFLEHTLMVSDFMVCLELACRQAGNIKIVGSEEIIARSPAKNYMAVNPYKIKINKTVDVNGESRRIGAVIPDKLFGLHFSDDPEGKNRAYFFLEADRGTMPIIRRNFNRTSFFKKIVGYYHAWHEDIFKETFGFKNARVLTITTSDQRIKDMVKANVIADQLNKGLRMFLFARANKFNISNPSNVIDKVWINGRQEKVSIVE